MGVEAVGPEFPCGVEEFEWLNPTRTKDRSMKLEIKKKTLQRNQADRLGMLKDGCSRRGGREIRQRQLLSFPPLAVEGERTTN